MACYTSSNPIADRVLPSTARRAVTITMSNSDEAVGLQADQAGFRRQMFHSLAKIQRYLMRRDPRGLQRISRWYAGDATASSSSSLTPTGTGEATDAGVSPRPDPHDLERNRLEEKRRRRRLRRRQRKQRLLRMYSDSGNNCSSTECVKRLEQNDIANSKLEYLPIPKGTASRSLLVPPQPDWLFSDSPELEPPIEDLQLDSNVNNIEESSRRSIERERARKLLDRWVFLYFLMLRANWESTLVEEKKTAPDINMYAEEHLHKWTVRLRFKIMRQVALKVALCGFLSRMGLETNARIVFCRDGFYGLMDVGNIYGELTKTPHAQISLNLTPNYMGLKNGDCIFVNSCSATTRQMIENAQRLDMPGQHKRSHTYLDAGSVGYGNVTDSRSSESMEPDDEDDNNYVDE